MPTKRPPVKKPTRKRILIVDGHALVRRALTVLINGEPDLVVCGEADAYAAGLDTIAALQPDLVTTDLSLDASFGLALLTEITRRHPDLPVLVVSMHDEPVYAERAFAAGAKGYVAKTEMGETVPAAIRSVLGGTRYVSPVFAARLARK